MRLFLIFLASGCLVFYEAYTIWIEGYSFEEIPLINMILLIFSLLVFLGISYSRFGKRRYKKTNDYSKYKKPFSVPTNGQIEKKTQENEKAPVTYDYHSVYRLREYPFDSVAEKEIYWMLCAKLEEKVKIDFHVHLNEIFMEIDANSGKWVYNRNLYFLHTDILIRDAVTMHPLYGIEVEWAERDNKKEADDFVDYIFNINQVPHVRIKRRELENAKLNRYDDSTYPAAILPVIDYIRFRTNK